MKKVAILPFVCRWLANSAAAPQAGSRLTPGGHWWKSITAPPPADSCRAPGGRLYKTHWSPAQRPRGWVGAQRSSLTTAVQPP